MSIKLTVLYHQYREFIHLSAVEIYLITSDIRLTFYSKLCKYNHSIPFKSCEYVAGYNSDSSEEMIDPKPAVLHELLTRYSRQSAGHVSRIQALFQSSDIQPGRAPKPSELVHRQLSLLLDTAPERRDYPEQHVRRRTTGHR